MAPPTSVSDAGAYVKYGVDLGAHGDLNGAIAAFDKAIEIDPKYALAYGNRGYAHSLQHKFADAVLDYNKAIQIDPSYVEGFYLRGVSRAQEDDFDGAISDFNKALSLRPKYADAYYNLGHAKYFKGDLDGALDDINQALSLGDSSPYTYFIRGLVRHAKGDREGAGSDFQSSAGATFTYGTFWLWIVKMESGDRGLARTDLADFVAKPELFRNDPWASQIADFLLDKISQNDLIAKSSQDNGEKSHLCEAWFYIGMTKYFSGDNKGAITAFQSAIATGSKDSEEYIESARLLAKLQSY